jgi:hypothetical protein
LLHFSSFYVPQEMWTKKKPKGNKVAPDEGTQQNLKVVPRGYDKVHMFTGRPEEDEEDDDDGEDEES